MSRNFLSSQALLARLSVSQWSGRKLDRSETSAVKARHALTVEAARVNKDLLPMSLPLQHVHKKTTFIRNEFGARTLPWSLDGVGLVKAASFMDFSHRFGEHMSEWRQLVGEFVRSYPDEVSDAQRTLGSLYNANDYPDVDTLRARFRIGLRYLPVPDADDLRADIPDTVIDDMRRELEADVRDSFAEATQDVWRRVQEVVQRAVETLGDPERNFKSSLIGNAVELVQLLPSLNINDDPKLEEIRRDLKRTLCKEDYQVIKSDPLERSRAKAEAQRIMDKMAGMFMATAA